MKQIPIIFIVLLSLAAAARAEVEGGNFKLLFERTFRSHVTVLAATDRFLFVSDSGYAEDDNRPAAAAIQAKDGSIQGYSSGQRQYVVRLLLCNLSTGEIVHEFPGPVSRNPRISGFELSLNSPPLMLDDGFAFLTADWHLLRIKLPEGEGKPVEVWDLDIPLATKLTPRLSDDMGYLMPVVSRCGDVLLFTLNSSPPDSRGPLHITLVSVNLLDGKLRWTRTLGPTGAIDRSPSCVPLGPDKFAVVTATGDLQTFSLDGTLLHAFRPAGEFHWDNVEKERWTGPLWDLQRLDGNTLIAFAGESPEFGSNASSPICLISLQPDGAMKTAWTSVQKRGPVAPIAKGTNLYLRNNTSLTAYSLQTGRELWSKTNKDPSIDCAWAAPLVHDGFVYLATGECLEVYRDEAERVLVGTVEFTSPKPGKRSPKIFSPCAYAPPVIHDGTLYVAADDRLFALKLPLFPGTK